MLGKAVELRQLRRRVLHDRTIPTVGRCSGLYRRRQGCARLGRAGQGLSLRAGVQPEHGGDDAAQGLWNRYRAGASAIAHRTIDIVAQADLECGLALLHGALQDHAAAVCVRVLDPQAITGSKVGNGLQICRTGGEAFAELRTRERNRQRIGLQLQQRIGSGIQCRHPHREQDAQAFVLRRLSGLDGGGSGTALTAGQDRVHAGENSIEVGESKWVGTDPNPAVACCATHRDTHGCQRHGSVHSNAMRGLSV